MSHIFLKYYYMDFVAYCLRSHYTDRDYLPEKWVTFTDDFFKNLSDNDRAFLDFVFDKRYKDEWDGCSWYNTQSQLRIDSPGLAQNKTRLMNIERDFAEQGGLVNPINGNRNNL